MRTYRALVTLPNIGQTPVTIEARSIYEAKAKLEAMYGAGNVTVPIAMYAYSEPRRTVIPMQGGH